MTSVTIKVLLQSFYSCLMKIIKVALLPEDGGEYERVIDKYPHSIDEINDIIQKTFQRMTVGMMRPDSKSHKLEKHVSTERHIFQFYFIKHG